VVIVKSSRGRPMETVPQTSRCSHASKICMVDASAKLLYEILQYVRAQAVAALRNGASTIIDTGAKAKVYGLLDGNTTQKAIADATRVPKTTVNRHVAAFLRGGLAVPPSEYYENPRALFTLEELGLEFGDSTASEEVSATVTTA
jgi:hypothetical protein